MKRLSVVLLCASFVVAAGCEPAAVSPDLQTTDTEAATASKTGTFAVYEYQVRPAEGSGSVAYGVLQAWVGVPPNPIYPNPGPPDEPVVVLRGVLHNVAGETLQWATLAIDADGVSFDFEPPTEPCGTTFFRAAAVPPNPVYPEPGPPEIMLGTDEGTLVAYPEPGPPTVLDTEAGVPPIVIPQEPPPHAYPDPGPPNVPGACTATGIAG